MGKSRQKAFTADPLPNAYSGQAGPGPMPEARNLIQVECSLCYHQGLPFQETGVGNESQEFNSDSDMVYTYLNHRDKCLVLKQ